MDPDARVTGSLVGTTASGALLQIVAVLAPLYIGSVLVTELGGGSLRAGLWIATPALLVAILIATAFLRSGGGSWQQPAAWPVGASAALPKTILFVVITGVVVSVGIPVAQNLAVGVFNAVPPDTSRFAALRGNLPLLFMGAWISSAFGEEMLVRGFLLDRLTGVFGGGRLAVLLAVVISSLLFGLGHAYQGSAGVIAAGVAGVLYASFYLLSGRSVWVTVLAHGMLDTVGFIVIFASGGRNAAGYQHLLANVEAQR